MASGAWNAKQNTIVWYHRPNEPSKPNLCFEKVKGLPKPISTGQVAKDLPGIKEAALKVKKFGYGQRGTSRTSLDFDVGISCIETPAACHFHSSLLRSNPTYCLHIADRRPIGIWGRETNVLMVAQPEKRVHLIMFAM